MSSCPKVTATFSTAANVQLPQGHCHLFDGGEYSLGIGGVRLDRDRLSAAAFDVFHDPGGGFRAFGTGDRHVRAIGCQPLGDSRADAARGPSNESCLAGEICHGGWDSLRVKRL
jgi:hypothetical protein